MTFRSLYSIGSWIVSAGSWIFTARQTPEGWLSYHRHWRDFGTILVIIGVVVEILIDELWETPPLPLLRGKKATTRLRTKRERYKTALMLFAGIGLVAGGIRLEWQQGDKADDVSDQIRSSLQTRLTDAIREQTNLVRLIAGREIHEDAALAALQYFHGTPLWVASIGPPPKSYMSDTVEAENLSSAFREANNFAYSF